MSAMAQTRVKQNSSTMLSVEPEIGTTYIWELYTGNTKEFNNVAGNLSKTSAFFLSNINKGNKVTVQWVTPGEYFFKVTALNINGCTNNIKIGCVIVEDKEKEDVILKARDDSYDFDCMPMEFDILVNDVINNAPNRIITRLIAESGWNTQGGNFKINEGGIVSYSNPNPESNSTDSVRYQVTAIYNKSIETDTATIYINIGDINCQEPYIPIANDDQYTVVCNENLLNVVANDVYKKGFEVKVDIIEAPTKGIAYVDNKNNFIYTSYIGSFGTDQFKYELYYTDYPERYDEAKVIINIPEDLNCVEEDTTYVLFIPEAFTPNGDGVHDYWVVEGTELHPNATMKVFDRSGNKVFEQENYGNIDFWGNTNSRWWDGTDLRGKQVIPGVYLYVYTSKKKTIRGFVMVAYGDKGSIGN